MEDSHDLTFEMIHRACVRKLRRRHDRGADRSPERGSLSKWGEKNATVRVLAYSAVSALLLVARAVPSAPPLFTTVVAAVLS